MKDNELDLGQATPEDWTLTADEKLNFQSLFLLYLITEGKVLFPNFLTGRLRYIQKGIDLLEDKKLIFQKEEFDEKKVLGFKIGKADVSYVYEPSDEAFKIVKSYKKRYEEYIKLYDVYAYVDPEKGKFALNKYKKIKLKENGKELWWDYLNDDRWVDYRVPISVFKGLDPREFIFYSFIDEEKFMPHPDDDEHEWAETLFLGKIWDEMYHILDSSPLWEEQADSIEESKEIMETIINEGANVIKSQRKKLNKYIKEQNSKLYSFQDFEDLYKEEDPEQEYYFDDPVKYHGMHQYTPLGDPLFWLTAAVIL